MAEQLVWSPADGSADVDLTDEDAGYSWEAEGTRGLRSVTYAFATQTYAGIDGDDVQGVRAEANHPSVGLLVRAGSVGEFRRRTRALIHAMRPKAGPGTLTVTTEEGESRRLRCYVEGGLEGDESDDTTMPGRWWKLILKLYAPMPWWLGDPVTIDVGLGVGSAFFPFFPLRLSPSTIQGQFDVDLTGCDDDAYPVWTVTGPGSALTLTRETTSVDPETGEQVVVQRQIVVSAGLAAGQTMVIDTRQGRQSVHRGDLDEDAAGWNLMGSLSSDPALWPLRVGVNKVTAALTGATNNSRIVGIYEPRYAGI